MYEWKKMYPDYYLDEDEDDEVKRIMNARSKNRKEIELKKFIKTYIPQKVKTRILPPDIILTQDDHIERMEKIMYDYLDVKWVLWLYKKQKMEGNISDRVLEGIKDGRELGFIGFID